MKRTHQNSDRTIATQSTRKQRKEKRCCLAGEQALFRLRGKKKKTLPTFTEF